MPISVIETYNDLVFDVNKEENGDLSFIQYNQLLKRALLRFVSWVTGNMDDPTPPEMISTQKSRDWISLLIKKYPVQVQDGEITKPSDYYLFRDIYKLKGVPVKETDCDADNDKLEVIKVPIELLDNSKFTTRCNTSIERLKPKVKPISKLSGIGFEFEPKDIGSVTLEYYRHPKDAFIVSMVNTTFNIEVPDPNASVDIEFGIECKESILWFIKDQYFTHNRDMTGKSMEATPTGKPKE